MKKHARISISLLFGLLLALPVTMMTAQSDAHAQGRSREHQSTRQGAQRKQAVRPGTSTNSKSNSKRRTTTTTTTTTTSGTHIRNVRPNPSRPPVYRPAPHRPTVYIPPHRPPVYQVRPHRSRINTRYHHNRTVVHHHYVTSAPRVVYVEVDRPRLPELSCPSRTFSNQNEFEQWCETSRGVRHGAYIRRHSNGQIAIEGEYEYDQKEGLWTEWHANGEPRLEGEYSNNERVGSWVRWDQSGREVSVIEYR